jgi:8-oxo-dGTP diphosphatase
VRVRDIDWKRWRAKDPATLVFVVKDSSILLIRKKRGLGAGKINAPGGRLEPGETPLEAAIRETREEVGITPIDLSYAGVNLFQFVDGYSIHVHVFKARDFEGEPRETDEAAPLWVPVDKIPYDEMWEDDRLWIPLLLDDVGFSGRYVFECETMLDHELDIHSRDSKGG